MAFPARMPLAQASGMGINAFMTFVVILLGYSISKGIGVGMITFIAVKVCTGKVREISVSTWVIGLIFLAAFPVT